MDDERHLAGMPELHRQARPAPSLPPSLASLPPRSVPESRPTRLQAHYINLSVVGLVLGAIAIIIGWKTRIAAFLLAGFTVVAASVFHNNFADQTQTIMFLKDISITGGLLLLVANGAGRLSLDHRRPK